MLPRHPLEISFPAGLCRLGTSTPGQHPGLLPTAPCWGPPGTPHPNGGLAMEGLHGVTDSCGVPPQLGATSSCLHLGVTSAQVPPLFRSYHYSATSSAQVPPLLGHYLHSDVIYS